ncbi:MAG: fljL, partial [Phenylobacterium sp.]|nr:fljL [Phenylobacterium sp.]
MSISVHTNKAALVALQNLNKTNDLMGEVQNHINTGLKIATAKDNASVWSIAQNQRADIGALGAVKMSLDRANSIAEVSMTAGASVSDLLVQLKEKVVAAMDTSIDTASRVAL